MKIAVIWKDVDVICEGAGFIEKELVLIVTVRPDWNPLPSTVIALGKEDEVMVDGMMPLIVGELLPPLVDWTALPPHPAVNPKSIKGAKRAQLPGTFI